MIVWDQPGDAGGGGDKQQELGNDWEYTQFKYTFSVK